jgi:hypothetical protein
MNTTLSDFVKKLKLFYATVTASGKVSVKVDEETETVVYCEGESEHTISPEFASEIIASYRHLAERVEGLSIEEYVMWEVY